MKIILFVLLFSFGTLAWAGGAKKEEPTLKEMVSSTLMMKLIFQLKSIQLYCKADIALFCKGLEAMKQPGCVLDNRLKVSKACENLLMQEFGSMPIGESFVYHDFIIPKGSKIFRIQQNNQVYKVVTSVTTVYKGIILQPTSFNFQSETISPIAIAKTTEIDGIKFLPPSVVFSFDGFLRKGILAEDTIINGIAYTEGSLIFFFEKGVVEKGVLLVDALINGVPYKKDWSIAFFENGTVKSGVISKRVLIQGKQYDENTQVSYRNNGKVAYSFPIHKTMFNQDGSRKKFNMNDLGELQKLMLPQ